MEIKLDITTATVLVSGTVMRLIDRMESMKKNPNKDDSDALKVIYGAMHNTLAELMEHVDSFHESQLTTIEKITEIMITSIPDLVKFDVLEIDDNRVKVKGGSHVTH